MMIEINDVVELLAVSAYVAWQNTLSGKNSEAQDAYFERMRKPVIGDLVLEASTVCKADAIDRVGRLKSISSEPYPDWEDEDEEAPCRGIWTIETFDGRDFRWENCNFIVIPESVFNHQAKL